MGCVRLPEPLRSIAQQEAEANGLDPAFVEAVVIQEGGLRWPSNPRSDIAPGVYWDVTGYAHGPMAVHLDAATDAGYVGVILIDGQGRRYSPPLASIENSIKYGTKYLANRGTGAYGAVKGTPCESSDMPCLAAAYAGGSPVRNPDGSWVNQVYVDGVRGHYECITGRPLPDPRKQSGPITNPGQDPPTDPPPNPGTVICQDFRPELETILPFPMPSLPYFAFFSVILVGYGDLSSGTPTSEPAPITPENKTGRVFTPPRPQYITRFELTESMGGQNRCYVRFFDPNWDFSELIESYNPEPTQLARISFGYVSQETSNIQGPARYDMGLDLWSPEYNLRVWSYHPEFLGWGVEVEMSFFGVGGLMAATHRTVQHEEKTVDKILEGIAKDFNVDICTVPAKRLLVDGAALSTAVPKDKPFLQDESDWVFAQKLTMEAASEDNEANADYRIRINDATPSGKPMLHFHRPLYDSPPIRQYTYMRSQYGAVIEWRPDIQDLSIARLGGARAETLAFDPGAKEFKERTVDIEAVKNGTYTGPVSSSPIMTLTKDQKIQVKRKFPSAEGPVADFQVEGINFFEKAYHFKTGGTLIVLGDPLIRPSRNILLLVFTFRNGRDGELTPVLNFTSGVYNIREVRHVIQNGEYLSILELVKNNNFTPDGVEPESAQGALRAESAISEQTPFDAEASRVFFNTYPNNITR